MDKNRLTCETLRSELNRLAIRYTLTRGQGAALLFLWTIGLGFVLFILSNLLVILPWTVAVLGLVTLAARDLLRNGAAQEALLRALIEKRHPTPDFSDPSLKAASQKGKEIFVEIALKITGIEKAQGKDPALDGVLAD